MTRTKVATAGLAVALLNAASRGLRPHCRDAGSWLWLSEDAAERRRAGRLSCLHPVRQAAEERDERFGVWSGRDRTSNQGDPMTARERLAFSSRGAR
jgi:hypothetical protein